jgi:hypothetical protein
MESESSSKTEPSSDEVEGGIGEETAEPAEPTDEEAAASSNVLGRGKLSPTDEKTMGMLAHLLVGVTYLLGPLVSWAIKKDESPFVNDQGKEDMNFQITVISALVVSTVAGAVHRSGHSKLKQVGCVAGFSPCFMIISRCFPAFEKRPSTQPQPARVGKAT